MDRKFADSLLADPKRRALNWLHQCGVKPDQLQPLSGYTNHVFLIEQSTALYPRRSVLRLADTSLAAGLCPLAHHFDDVLRKHVDVAELGLAPRVIAADKAAGVMWLDHAGEQKALEREAFTEIRGLLEVLHGSGGNWPAGVDDDDHISLEVLLRNLLQDILTLPPTLFPDREVVNRLIQQAGQRGYFHYPSVPTHGDLNPGNCLHDGKRWWLIDWDFAGVQQPEWDFAGLIVEHGWDSELAAAFAPDIPLADLIWFCSGFAVLSWFWHQQRGSNPAVLQAKQNIMQYWITRKG